MKTLDIAVNASRVWHILEGTYSITTNQVKKLLSLSDKDFFAAIGWSITFIVMNKMANGMSAINSH